MPSDAFVTLVSVQPAQAVLSSTGVKFQNRPQGAGREPASLYGARRESATVRAMQAQGFGVTPPPSSVVRPPAIADLTATPLADAGHTIRLSFANQTVVPVVEYRVFYSTSPIFDPNTWLQAVYPAPGNSPLLVTLDVSGLTPGATYYFVVRGENAYGDGPLTPYGLSAAVPLDPPAAPGTASLFSAGTGFVSIWWDKVLGATGFVLYTKASVGVTKLDTRVVIPSLTPPYRFAAPSGAWLWACVAAVGPGGEGPLSRETSALAP